MSEEKPKVLIVDDDEIILLALTESLTPRGYAVFSTNNPLEALEILKSHNFAVIISDQRMAEMNGLDFLCECKQRQPEASRILITGVQTISTLIEAVNRSEIFRFVAKPWMREELIATIEEAARRYDQIWNKQQGHLALLERVKSLEAKVENHKREGD